MRVIGFKRFLFPRSGRPDGVVTRSMWWRPGEVEVAVCDEGHREVPAEECKCGIYAYNTAERFPSYCHGLWGAVRGGGEVLHGREYWRAQYAELLAFGEPPYPDALWFRVPARQWVRTVAERYSVPVLVREDLCAYVEEFGKYADEARRTSGQAT